MSHDTVDMDMAEINGGPLPNQTSVFKHIEQGLRRNPHGHAVVCMHQPADHLSSLVSPENDSKRRNSFHSFECLTLTYSQLHSTALRLAAALTANGVRPGSTILMAIPNGAEYCLLLWTCIVMRLTFVSLDPAVALGTSGITELESTLEAVKPSSVVVPNAADVKVLDAAAEKLRFSRPFCISLDSKTSDGCKSFVNLVAESYRYPLDEADLLEKVKNDDPNRIHSIIFTSGTSGRPKGCPLRVGGVTHMMHSWSWLINKDNCKLALQQAHNSRGIAPANTLQTWREGGAVVTSGNGFHVDDMVEAIVRYRATFVVMTPPMVHSLGKKLASRPFNVKSVRTIQLGGDAVTKDVFIQCATLFPLAKVCINHGMTEGGACFTWPFLDEPANTLPFFGQICPVGAVARGATARIWNPEKASVARRGQPGELHLCSNSIIPKYLRGESATSFYQDKSERWFITGDIAMINNNGTVFILGRSKDTIKHKGIAIMPAVIESCIKELTGTQTSVVAVPSQALGHKPFAVVENFKVKTEGEIRNHVAHTLGKDYALEGVSSLETVGLRSFPLNPTGKVMKDKVQSAVLDHLSKSKSSRRLSAWWWWPTWLWSTRMWSTRLLERVAFVVVGLILAEVSRAALNPTKLYRKLYELGL